MERKQVKISLYILIFGFTVSLGIAVFPVGFSGAANKAIVTSFFSFDTSSVGGWINSLYRYGLAIIGIIAAVAIVFAGVQYMTSMGNPEAIKKAKQGIVAGLSGLILLLLSHMILKTIDPRLVQVGIETPEIDLPTSSNDRDLVLGKNCSDFPNNQCPKVAWWSIKSNELNGGLGRCEAGDDGIWYPHLVATVCRQGKCYIKEGEICGIEKYSAEAALGGCDYIYLEQNSCYWCEPGTSQKEGDDAIEAYSSYVYNANTVGGEDLFDSVPNYFYCGKD